MAESAVLRITVQDKAPREKVNAVHLMTAPAEVVSVVHLIIAQGRAQEDRANAVRRMIV